MNYRGLFADVTDVPVGELNNLCIDKDLEIELHDDRVLIPIIEVWEK